MPKRKAFLLYLFLVLTTVLIGGASGFIMFSFWDLPEIHSLEEYRPSITSHVYSADKKQLAEFFIENRIPVSLDDIPPIMIKALIAAEDSRFYHHHGIDLHGIMRALFRNIRAGKILEGGSTLTQQLAKLLFLTPERSYTRKLKEMALALRIEQRYTKKEILSLYLNQIYFGSGAYGIEAAAQIYFNKHAKDLNAEECALLAGLPRSPKYYSPFSSPDSARRRRAYVADRMAATGAITALEAEAIKKAALPTRPATAKGDPAPYFVEYIRQKVEERFGSKILYSGGLNIYTSINEELQNDAEKAIALGLKKIEARHAKKGSSSVPLQAALIAIDPTTGRIRAMVGGRNYDQSQFNRAWQALRQPGSAFKPVIFTAALDRGFGAADILDDSPLLVRIDNSRTWSPENYTRTYHGPVTLQTALALSLNVPTVRLFEKIGADTVIKYARKLGIKSPLNPYPSLALGSSDVTLLELTSAYSVFAAHGIRMSPVSILAITDSTGRVLYANDERPVQAIKPETAFLITNLLRGAVERGTGWKARQLGRPVAGKTGTTNDFRDAWFIGYTPSLVAGVWVGYDDHRSIGQRETGARAALPIWIKFMKQALAGREPENFSAPDDIIYRQIDPKTGLLSSGNCSKSIREAFLPGTEPKKYCDKDGASIDGEEAPIPDEAPQSP